MINVKKVMMQGTSMDELKYFYYFKKYFPDTKHRFKFEYEKKKKTEIDIYIPSIDVGIEYDGFHHSYKEIERRDKKKNKILKDSDIFFIRIRDSRLPKSSEYNFFAKPHIKEDFEKTFFDTINLIFKKIGLSNNFLKKIKKEKFKDDVKIYDFYKKTRKEKSILKTHPELSKIWDYKKNGELLPEHITNGSAVEIWWKCDVCWHEWLMSVHEISRIKRKCKKCNSIAIKKPELIKEWHSKLNKGKTPFDYTRGASDMVWWICPNEHEYKMSINQRGKGRNCPYCHSMRLDVSNSLYSKNPKLASEWHPTLNGDKTPKDVFASSRTERAWWQCLKNPKHIWEAQIHTRHHSKQGCPFCAGKIASEDNNFKSSFPTHSKQWHKTKNEKLSPENVTKKSGKKVWWQCEKCNYEWEQVVRDRGRTVGKCPSCKQIPK